MSKHILLVHDLAGYGKVSLSLRLLTDALHDTQP